MKKYIYTIVAVLMLQITAFSQSRYAFIEYKDVQKPAVQSDFSYPEKTVTNAIEEKLNKMGYKSKDTKGYSMYKGVMLPELGTQTYDLYFKVDRKAKRDKDNTTVSMLISSGNENFISDSSDSGTMNNAKRFLDNLMPSIASYDLQQQVNAQEDAVKKAEKKYKSLQNDGDDLQSRKKKIEQQIDDNQKDQKNQSSEVEKQRQLLETLKARQK